MAKTAIPATIDEKAFDGYISEKIEAAFASRGVTEDARTAFKKADDHDKKFDLALRIFRNNGFLTPQDSTKFRDTQERDAARVKWGELVDAIATPDVTLLMPRVVTQIAKEAIEPQLTLTPLLRTLRFTAGTSMTFPAVSAMSGVADMAEADEYPELIGPRFAGTVTAKMGKVGCAVRITEEMLRYSQWDVMRMMIQGAGKAMARHKEVKVANLILDNAVVSFDNTNPGSSTNGATTGRDINGDFNDTLTLDDIFVTYSDLINDGFIPNTILVNAAGWLIFARDPAMRAFNWLHGSGPLWKTPSGSNAQPWQGGEAGQEWQSPVTAANLLYKSTLQIPVSPMFPVPLQVVVSPFINYDSVTKKTDLIVCDREELGMMVVDEEMVTDQWEDPNRDVRRIKFRERYGFCVLNEGQAIRKLANVSTNRGYDFENDKTNWDLATSPLPSV
jgi:hypothetical protein